MDLFHLPRNPQWVRAEAYGCNWLCPSALSWLLAQRIQGNSISIVGAAKARLEWVSCRLPGWPYWYDVYIACLSHTIRNAAQSRSTPTTDKRDVPVQRLPILNWRRRLKCARGRFRESVRECADAADCGPESEAQAL